MAQSIYLASPSKTDRSTVVAALTDSLSKAVSRVGTFRPFAAAPAAGVGVTWEAYYADPQEALTTVVDAFRTAAKEADVLVLDGTDGTAAPGTPELSLDAQVAANTGSPLVLVLDGSQDPATLEASARVSLAQVQEAHATVGAVLVLGGPGHALSLEGVEVVTLPAGADLNESEALETLLGVVELPTSQVVTPLMFQAGLVDRARADRKTIVLPEPDDDRILQAADEILRRGIADLVLLGDETTVRARATELGLDISAARVVATNDPELLETYAAEFARLRAKKGVTLEQARQTVQDVSYFGTMMVHMGQADGMVSGAAHTTAHTILPSFQIIKTKPGTAIVSSVFLMLMEDRVWAFGDCAVNPNPTPEQLADIALSSAQTAQQFGVEPKVAMLSYSTGTSGTGPDVDAVVEATRLAREKAPELAIEGPIQFDASVDEAVAAKKLPGSAVAGHANVFVFPSLNAGNIGYKAVQRSSGAIAVGPVLQGLNKPVNDLSRGALVEDIINTVAITAVQAQG